MARKTLMKLSHESKVRFVNDPSKPGWDYVPSLAKKSKKGTYKRQSPAASTLSKGASRTSRENV